MEKALHITINGQVFYIEEQAHKKLEEYLDSVNKYFSDYEDSKEIVNDIENRVAEKMSSKKSAKKEVINLRDVEEIIKSMGTIEDFAEFDEGEEKKSEEKTHGAKRLQRDPDDRIIGGVASGIAAYFAIDPILVRLGLALSLFLGGAGVIVYIILWVIMPEAKTTSEKLEMRGTKVTLKQIEEEVKKKAEQMEKPTKRFIHRLGSFTRQIFIYAGKFIRGFFKIISKIIGVIIAGATIFSIALILFFLTAVAFNLQSPYVDFPFRDVFTGGILIFSYITATILVLIPLILLAGIGISLIKSKWIFNLASGITLLITWVIALTIGGVIAFRVGPEIEEKARAMEYARDVKTIQVTNLEPFTKIDANTRIRGTISRGAVYSITATGPEKDLDRYTFEVIGDTLVIDRKHTFCIFCIIRSPEVQIIAPVINELSLGSSSEISMTNNTENVDIRLTGSSDLEFNGYIGNLDLYMSGSADATLTGFGNHMDVEIYGSSRLEAVQYRLQNADVLVSSSSRANLFVVQEISGEVRSSGRLRYIGSPQLNIETRSSGRVERL